MNITSGKVATAKKTVIYGTEGIGKSTLASQFPDVLFIDTEGSTKELDVKRFEDAPSSWEMLLAQVDYVIKNKPCKTLTIDTIDWAERLCIDSVCKAHGKKGIEDFGYGNGYTYEAEEFGRFLNRLEDVIDVGINVTLVAHAVIRKFEQPDEMGAYDRYELKLGKKTTNQIAPMVKEWADMVLFCNYKTMSIATDEKGKKHKAQGGRRTIYTSHHPCWDAKNRYGLPDEIPMDYEQIRHIVEIDAITPPTPIKKNSGVDINTAVEDDTAEPVSNVSTVEQNVEESEDWTGIPKALQDLMKANDVLEKEIRYVVSTKGYFPSDMPVKDYPQDFINGVLIAAWSQVYSEIDTIKQGDLPF